MIQSVFADATLEAFRGWMDRYERFVLLTHVSPDGDAMGSSLAMMHYLQEKGKEARVIVPNAFPDFFRWMPRVGTVVQYDFHKDTGAKLIEEAEAIICLDFNALNRIGAMGEVVAAAAKPMMLIDHHPYPAEGFEIVCSHPFMCATAEVLYRLIDALGEADRITPDCAACLYTGLMTDTGGFTYNSVRPEIFEIVSRLLAVGVDKDEIYHRVFNSNSEGRMKLMGYTLYNKMKVYPELRTALIWLTQDELKRFGYVKGDTEGFVNLPLQIRGVSFSCFLREDKTMIKVSLRSVGNFSCTEFASRLFNGGGHRNASGGEFYDTMDKAVARFEEGLEIFRPELERKKR